ncbi:MAG: helix-turn-helix domain-containing protein [Lachnospiraceae bacterium]|nr:helix-turn-helix domain-containing protein [Lachnospiraceae bacterium]
MGISKDRALAMGRSIRTLRSKRNLTQKELANLSGISESSLRSYELGARYPKAECIVAIAEALGVPPESLDTCNITTELELLHALFRAENQLGIFIDCYGLVGGGSKKMQEAMNKWCRMSLKLKEGEITEEQYQDWKDTYTFD